MHGYYPLFIRIPMQFNFRRDQKQALLSASLGKYVLKTEAEDDRESTPGPAISLLIMQIARTSSTNVSLQRR